MNGSLENGYGVHHNQDLNDQQFDHLEKTPEQSARERLNSRVLPENRQERLAILLKNLPNEDLVHIDDSRIPAILRIDKDVKAAREKLHGFQEQYMQFNISQFDTDVKHRLANKISDVSKDFQTHR